MPCVALYFTFISQVVLRFTRFAKEQGNQLWLPCSFTVMGKEPRWVRNKRSVILAESSRLRETATSLIRF